ncbi:hypothetical protein DPMN_100605 [Dreissena polymorpha]|uniref:Uncharacterized protein n=1 Tax=Dreissena polymorpha TaxID=45954 RepID=A0A9D4R7K2_DREPO|nr:hypothetical protein DPMN_100605 [Dreissena polymorpha]
MALANSVDPDETPHDAASHQGLRCLVKGISYTNLHSDLLFLVLNYNLIQFFWFQSNLCAEVADMRKVPPNIMGTLAEQNRTEISYDLYIVHC